MISKGRQDCGMKIEEWSPALERLDKMQVRQDKPARSPPKVCFFGDNSRSLSSAVVSHVLLYTIQIAPAYSHTPALA